jgi:Ca2+:H+ antiporter
MQPTFHTPTFRAVITAIAIPVFGIGCFVLHHYFHGPFIMLASVFFLFATVMSAVHHAEIISARIGEPFGALVLALCVTIIESSIILSMMFAGGENVSSLARDTVFAALMIILTGMCGLTLFIGGLKYREQFFGSLGVTSILTVLVAICVLTLILPNFTISTPGPYYSKKQLAFVAIITFLLYLAFLFVQNIRHRNDFVTAEELQEVHDKPGKKATWLSAILLPINLTAVVLLAESLAPDLEAWIHKIGAPPALSGIIIACVVLLPEGISAVKAALANKMQKSLNLSLGSALASISLTIPVVALVSLWMDLPLALGIGTDSSVIFLLSLFSIILSLSKGRTNILQGLVLIILFFVYLFITINP